MSPDPDCQKTEKGTEESGKTGTDSCDHLKQNQSRHLNPQKHPVSFFYQITGSRHHQKQEPADRPVKSRYFHTVRYGNSIRGKQIRKPSSQCIDRTVADLMHASQPQFLSDRCCQYKEHTPYQKKDPFFTFSNLCCQFPQNRDPSRQ